MSEKTDTSVKEVSINGDVDRKLKQRHISMIAIGGTIGTGLFLGTSQALTTAGPVGLLLGYTIMGAVVYGVQMALGEMVSYLPISGAITHFAGRFLDPAASCSVGFNLWYSAGIGLATEITAAAIIVEYWDTVTNVGIYISVFAVTICTLNFLGVGWFGEAEFCFALLKVTMIVILIIAGIVLDLGGGPSHDFIGFRYWKDPGPFTQLFDIPGALGRFLAFWQVFIYAAFAYVGTETVAVAAGEAENPRKTVPKAIKRVFYRILVFYLGGVFVIGLLVPSDDPRLFKLKGSKAGSSSPFVIAMERAGLKVLPDLINAVILTSAFSAGNTSLYVGSRILYGLALEGQAPSFFKRCTAKGLPIWTLAITASFSLLAFLRLNSSGTVLFRWLSHFSSVTGLCTWLSILLSYIRFYHGMKYQGINRATLPYVSPFQPYLSYFASIMIILIIIFNGFSFFIQDHWSTSEFIAAYGALLIYLITFLYWKFTRKTKWIKSSELDFFTGIKEIEEVNEMYKKTSFVPKTKIEKFWDWLF
ncbi:amino acid permease/ SLC12A domain-containing protein [Melampsora americana]|nr:amino acid permease/ SLC12A domain-containing protein [Melampsora americana]